MQPRRLARALALLLLLASAAGCVKDEPVATGAIEDEDPAEAPAPAPADPAPPAPSPQPAAPPPAPPAPSPAPAAQQPPQPPPPEPRVVVLAWSGNVTGVGGSVTAAPPPAPAVCCAQVAPAGENVDESFAVESPKGIVVELVWSDAQFDLDLVLEAADFDPAAPSPTQPYGGHRWIAGEGAPGQPDGHARIVLAEPEALAIAGDWTWRVNAKGPANAVAFSVYVSLFLDEAPPADHAAAPSA